MNIRIVRSSNGGKNPLMGGIIFTALFGLATLACLFSDNAGELLALTILFAIFTMGGVSLIVKSVHDRKKTPVATHEFDADAPEFVKERLNELMFEGKTTVKSSKTIKRVTVVGPDGVKRTTETIIENGDQDAPHSYHAGNVTCPSCGAVTKLRRGQNAVCEYCGTHIQG